MYKYNFIQMLKDMFSTIVFVPIHLAVCIYAVFLQCFNQLKYDYLNNRYEIRK